MEDILKVLNKLIREEHGNRITIKDTWIDANVDSFGTTMIFLELDDRYGCFDKDWLSVTNISELSIDDIITRITNESTKL